ncbi:MAG: hypothetical protein ACRDE5_08340 [Ginsengibacter sp.]
MKKFVYYRPLLLLFLLVLQVYGVNSQTNIVKYGVKYDTIIRKHVTKPLGKPVTKQEVILPVPEFINQPYYFDDDHNALIKLENVMAQLNTRKKTFGLKGAEKFLSIDGPSSKIRITAKKGIVFFIKTSGDVIDLTSYIKLYWFLPADQKREVTLNTKEGVLNNKDEAKGKQIGISVNPISKDNYQVELPEQMDAGEYGFVWVKNLDLKEFTVFAFGIDWKRSD